MNMRRWLGRQVRGAACRARQLASLARRCGKAEGCTAQGACIGNGGKGEGRWIQRVLKQGATRMRMQNAPAVKLLDEVMAQLEAAVQGGSGSSRADGAAAGGAMAGFALQDAIDRELAARPMQTAVERVRQSEVVEQFRRELETQSLTVTTVTSFLQLLQEVLPGLLTR